MSNLDQQVQDLLNALQLEPRKAWAHEIAIPSAAGRCAGSYGCGPPNSLDNVSKNTDDFFSDLSCLVAAGVHIEHAIVALVRKYQRDGSIEKELSNLVSVMQNPYATKADFIASIRSLHGRLGPSSLSIEEIIKAIEVGCLDAISDGNSGEAQ